MVDRHTLDMEVLTLLHLESEAGDEWWLTHEGSYADSSTHLVADLQGATWRS